MRTMFDGTHSLVPNIPLDAQLVAGYLPPSPFAWTTADWARFLNAVHVRIAVRASTNDGHVLDVESGDATPAQAPGWVVMRRAAGADPTVYCSTSLWPSVRAAFQAANVAEPHYWVASYPGGGAVIPAGAVAHQYMDAGIYDKSVVADYWPGVDGEFDVATADQITDIQLRVASMHAGQWLPWSGVPGAPGGDLSWFQQQMTTALAPVLSQLTAIQGALSTDDAAILTAVQGVDADTKAGIAQLATAITALPADQPPTDAQMAAFTAAMVKALPGYTVNIMPTNPSPPAAS